MPLFEAKNQLVSAFERAYLVASLKAHEGNKAAVARAAGVDRGHLYRLLKKYGIDDDERG
jgi:DNA-binding NtrC family response regulator